MLYLDTNILIYLFERHDVYSHQVAEVLEASASADVKLVTSAITVVEFLAGTVSDDLETLRTVPRLHFVSLDEGLAKQAAALQRENNLQIGDAIHLATAIAHSSDDVGAFFTNDRHLAKIAKRYIIVKQL